MPKFKADIELSIIKKIQAEKILSLFLTGIPNKHVVYYHKAPSYWTRAHDYPLRFWSEKDGEKLSTKIMRLYTRNDCVASLCALINSSLFYWWFFVMSNGRDANEREVYNFPLNLEAFHKTHAPKLILLVEKLMANYRDNSTPKNIVLKVGRVSYDEFHPKYGKLIMDEIDKILAKHYNFSEEELDYIINYDYKYRMGGAE